MDPYRVRLTPQAQRDLNDIPEKVAPAILDAIFGFIADNPQRAGKPLGLHLSGLHSARRGQYRIVYRIVDDEHAINIERIGPHRDAYR